MFDGINTLFHFALYLSLAIARSTTQFFRHGADHSFPQSRSSERRFPGKFFLIHLHTKTDIKFWRPCIQIADNGFSQPAFNTAIARRHLCAEMFKSKRPCKVDVRRPRQLSSIDNMDIHIAGFNKFERPSYKTPHHINRNVANMPVRRTARRIA